MTKILGVSIGFWLQMTARGGENSAARQRGRIYSIREISQRVRGGGREGGTLFKMGVC